MAHFAKLDANNQVVEILVVHNDDVQNLPFPESEPIGIAYLDSIFGVEEGFTWKQTSYNKNFRKCYAVVGGVFDVEKDAFMPLASEFASWVFNEDKWLWEAPVPYPAETDNFYQWDESTLSWV